MNDFLMLVKHLEKQGDYLFNNGLSALEVENGKLHLSEGVV